MRNLTICASVALGLLLVSPGLSGGRGGGGVAGVPSAASAVTRTAPPGDATGAAPAVEACFRRYRRDVARCGRDDGICHLRAADRWDVCEATGF